eukprot:374224_1
MTKKKRGNWTHKKRRTTTCNISLSDKKKKQIWNKKYHKKKKMNSTSLAPPPISSNINTSNYTNTLISNIEFSDGTTNNSAEDISMNVIESTEPEQILSISWNTALTSVVEENKKLKQEKIQDKEAFKEMKRKYENEKEKRISERKRRIAAEMDIERIINESQCEQNALQDEFKPTTTLTVDMSLNFSIGLTEKSFDPKFMKAFYDFIKIRLKLSVLKSSASLTRLIHIMNIYNDGTQNGCKKIELGGTSYGSVDRVMQYKAKQLIQIETCFIVKTMWQPNKSVMSMGHDECSDLGESQMSVVMAFDADIPTQLEIEDPALFTPELQCGNIVRGIWHQNIPSKDSATSVKWAIKPAIDELDVLGSFTFGNKWIFIRDLIGKQLAMMTDQNAGAQKTSELTGLAFKVKLLQKYVCFMHIVDNMLITCKDRLLLDRDDENEEELKADELQNCRNIDIMDICNRLQKALSQKCDSLRNKGCLFAVFTSYSNNKESFVDWCRVTGERRQFTIRNVDAAISRRQEILEVSKKKQGNKYLVSNARICLEFGLSITLLREAIVMTSVKRNYTEQIVVCMGKTLQNMNEFLPVVKESLYKLERVQTNKIFAIKTLFTMVSFFQYENMEINQYEQLQSNIITNKLLSLNCKLKIVQCTDEMSQWIKENQFIDASGFLQNAITIFTEDNICLKDKYFYHLFRLSPTHLQGVYGNMYHDLKGRIKLQSSGQIPKSVPTVNDNTESLNATGKYSGRYAPNIEETTKAGHAIGVFNKDCWNTFDYLRIYEPKIFMHILIKWYTFCGTYKKAIKAKKQYKKAYHRAKWKKLKQT